MSAITSATSAAFNVPSEALINIKSSTAQLSDNHILDRTATPVEIEAAQIALIKKLEKIGADQIEALLENNIDKLDKADADLRCRCANFKLDGKKYYVEKLPYRSFPNGPSGLRIVEYNKAGGPVSESWTPLPKVTD
jgi:hypothetical protein